MKKKIVILKDLFSSDPIVINTDIKTIILDSKNNFWVGPRIDNKLSSWMNFLKSEVRYADLVSLWKDFAFTILTQDTMSGNLYQLLRYKGKIYLGFFWYELPLDKEYNALPMGILEEFPITIENFIELLDEWKVIMEEESQIKELIVKEDSDGRITIKKIYK